MVRDTCPALRLAARSPRREGGGGEAACRTESRGGGLEFGADGSARGHHVKIDVKERARLFGPGGRSERPELSRQTRIINPKDSPLASFTVRLAVISVEGHGARSLIRQVDQHAVLAVHPEYERFGRLSSRPNRGGVLTQDVQLPPRACEHRQRCLDCRATRRLGAVCGLGAGGEASCGCCEPAARCDRTSTNQSRGRSDRIPSG
jgi:hypothetical protein